MNPAAMAESASDLGGFIYNAADHHYIDARTGEIRPHITGMLVQTGYTDERWFTDEARIRGTAVHDMTLAYDLGALDPEDVVSEYKPFFLAYVKAMKGLPHAWEHLEEAFYHPTYRYGGRLDRAGTVEGCKAILEAKTGQDSKAYPIQTALQAILIAPAWRLKPEHIKRYCVRLLPTGRCKVEEHVDRSDYDRAYQVIRETCR